MIVFKKRCEYDWVKKKEVVPINLKRRGQNPTTLQQCYCVV